MKLFLIFLTMALNSNLWAKDWTGISPCGRYKITGVARIKNKKIAIIANEKTLSEIVIEISSSDEPLLAPHLDRPVEARIKVLKKAEINYIEGKIEEIKTKLPNPLDSNDNKIELITNQEC